MLRRELNVMERRECYKEKRKKFWRWGGGREKWEREELETNYYEFVYQNYCSLPTGS